MNLEELYNRSQKITTKYIEKNGIWDSGRQLAHIHSEVSEAFDVLRRPQKYENPIESFVEESCDIILATLTSLNLHDIPPDVFEYIMEKTLKKAEDRIKE